jgi:2-phospho-L-lactate transferase/gluconeogenesis factor (CofD/UPF0052 family)
MKVVVLSGGTGSKAIQDGFHHLFGSNLSPTLLINAYDNGLSTGAVRKVLDGKILGPSDLRKNQEHQAKLHDTVSVSLMKLLSLRINASSAEDMEEKIHAAIHENLQYPSQEEMRQYLLAASESFFSLPNADLISYDDFSIANVFYAGVAYQNNYSLALAGKEFANNVFKIPEDRVLLVSDESLFLQAVTQSGSLILDEGDIVKWANEEDPIVSIKLVNSQNVEVVPDLTEEAKEKLLEADVIIFSSGTQWSSLIPTYIHKGFRETIEASKAKKYLVMNNYPDQDMAGLNSNDILETLSEYLPLDQIKVVFNDNAHPLMKNFGYMRDNYGEDSFIEGIFSEENTSLHDHRLVAKIMKDYMKGGDKGPTVYMFDFDDTLVDKRDVFSVENAENLYQLKHNPHYVVVSGNSINHLNTKLAGKGPFKNRFYCDGGNSFCRWDYSLNRLKFVEYVDENLTYSQSEIEQVYSAIVSIGVPVWKIENRNNCIISVKPLSQTEREEFYVQLVQVLGPNYEPKLLGRTTIDIFKAGYDKTVVLNHFQDSKIIYVGDEVENGNDAVFKDLDNVHTHSVSNPLETLSLLMIISANDQ